MEGWADAEEQVGVNGGFVIETLQGASCNTNTVSEPFVGMALAAKFIADKVAYVYLHSGRLFVQPATDSLSIFRRPQIKKEGEQSRLQCAVVEYLSKERPNTRLSASICLCCP